MFLKQWCVFGLSLVLLAACGGGGNDDSFISVRNRSNQETCAEYKAKLPAEYVQSYISVPEDYENPSGRQIQIFYYHNIKTNGGTPVVFFNGGPGSNSHYSVETFEEQNKKKKLSLVIFDQRGTGCSSNYPTESSAETYRRLQYYGSTEIVKDAEMIRKALIGENSKWKVFGQSYGGYIVHRYVALYPQSITAAYSHGMALPKNSSMRMYYRLLSQKRIVQLYFDKFPADRARWTQMRSMVADNMCFTDGDNEVCGNAILDSAAGIIGFRSNWDGFHTLINAVDLNNPQEFRRWMQSFVNKHVLDGENSNARGVIRLVEGIKDENNESNCRGALKMLKANGEDPSSWPINECRDASTGKSKSDREWDAYIDVVQRRLPLHLNDVMAKLNANPNLPFYLYSGELDMIVPIEAFAPVIPQMTPRVRYTQFPNTGHDGYYTEDQVWNDLASN